MENLQTLSNGAHHLAQQDATLFITLLTGTATGFISLQEIDLILAVGLKVISGLSFSVAFGYGIWKWATEYKNQKKITGIISDRKNENIQPQ